ncbi:peptidoglycan recognition protein 6 isoform X1 [Alosa sapidissima]|uniref:peptidoglycan recognition protein 6 isoform X1 n=1 Tax=Alosa sapidissima TaxID=34773 RepID=UPI001C09B506|nr:peptidoglycan recognition protein 6 isoform X1 [Alosa sapidissima]
MDFPWKWVLTISLVAICHAAADPPSHMNHFIQVVKWIETEIPGLPPIGLVKELRKSAQLDSPFIKRYLGALDDCKAVLNSTVSEYLSTAIHHKVTESGVEKGVVLTSDGTTVALAPLLLGIEAGLQSVSKGRVRGLYPLALSKTLAVSFLHHSRSSSTTHRLGPDGCWDSVTSPKVFTLSGVPSLATDAQVNGGMDGVILGMEVSNPSRRPNKLSTLLNQYYNYRLRAKGLDSAPRLISTRRRQNFVRFSRPGYLKRQVKGTLAVYEKLNRDKGKQKKTSEAMLERIIEGGIKAFDHRYTECPAIIPRCQWGAEPYRGTPTLLSLPLSFLYIHHTSTPGQPCLTFEECSRDMRSMQRFHQEDRGWDDIGYSFVAGSDGYIYEGRGWHWRGAHTKGHNSKGYGVSFIGDYMETLPSENAMNLVRHKLAMCAVSGGRLVSDYIVHGHRQVVATSCPGDAFYKNVQTWEHYREVQS